MVCILILGWGLYREIPATHMNDIWHIEASQDVLRCCHSLGPHLLYEPRMIKPLGCTAQSGIEVAMARFES
jgi:hypothetical protein